MKKTLTTLAVVASFLVLSSSTYAYTHQKSYSSFTKAWSIHPWKTLSPLFKVATTTTEAAKRSGGTKVATSTPIVTAPKTPVTPTTTPVVSTTGETRFVAYTTGYSYWDNTPAASAEISNPVLHKTAGGTGTYANPITLAVGHSIINGKDILDYPEGTKFYVPNLRKYFIVEDTCGDGNQPQNGPCHSGYKGNVWLDLYVDGATASRSQSDQCMDAITDLHTVIKNPASNYAVVAGDLSANCKQYGETVVNL